MKLTFDIKLPHIASDNSCSNEFKSFTNERVEKLKAEVNGLIRRCEEDVNEFARKVSNTKSVVAWCCSWTEVDWREYSCESTHYDRYFLHKYQAETCRDQHNGSVINEVTIFCNGQDYYKFVNQNGTTTQTPVYVELSSEDKLKQRREIEIANLQQRLQNLQNGGSGWY
jgi:hypothetical protein